MPPPTLPQRVARIFSSSPLLGAASRTDQEASSRPTLAEVPQKQKPKTGLGSLPGGNPALIAFALSLVAYTLQTEAAQYVQQGLGYRKPFLSLYLGHSGFIVLFPLHLLALRWYTGLPFSHYLHLVAQNLHWQLSTPTKRLEGEVQENIRRRLTSYGGRRSGEALGWAEHSPSQRGTQLDPYEDEDQANDAEQAMPRRPPLSTALSWRQSLSHLQPSLPIPVYTTWAEIRFGFDLPKLILLLMLLMAGITVPALSWYCAVPMTSMADITALYNTFSVWALVFSVWFLGERWNRFKVLSVVMAAGGVVIVAYGGAEHRRKPKEFDPVYGKPTASATATSSDLQATATTHAVSLIQEAVARATPTTTKLLRRLGYGLAARAGSSNESTSDAKQDADSPSNPLLGDFLALFGAVTMAAYEMAFKLLGTLPDEDIQRVRWDAVRGEQRGSHRASRGNFDDEEAEAEGLLFDRNTHHPREGEEQEQQHVVGDEEDEDEAQRETSSKIIDPWAETGKNSPSGVYTERTGIANLQTTGELNGSGQPPGYGSGAAGASSPLVYAPRSSQSHRQEALDPREVSDRIISKTSKYEDEDARSNDDDDEEESVVDFADAEELRAGSTRLGRPKSMAAASVRSARDTLRPPGEGRRGPSSMVKSNATIADKDTWIPPPLPFGLHANIMTAGIGAVTLSLLWIGVLLAHVMGWEPFEWPHNARTVFAILFVMGAGGQ